MKRLIIGSLFAVCVFTACDQKKENTTPENDGYVLNKSENIEYAKKTIISCAKGDLDTYKSLYADTAIFYNNSSKETLAQNIDLFKVIKAKGIEIKLDTFYNAFETVDKVADSENGAKNFIHIYCKLTFTKGDKKVEIPFYQANAIKDGKIVREYDYYDASELNELMK